MVQTLTIWANGISEINTGNNFLLCNGVAFTDALQEKLNTIERFISSVGISQLHVEKDFFRQFEHIVIAGNVTLNKFGETISPADFDWIMQHVDSEIHAQAAAAEAAAAEAAKNDEEEVTQVLIPKEEV